MSWCERCYGTGTLECLCGGDFCVCGLDEYDCPDCCGDYDDNDFNEANEVQP